MDCGYTPNPNMVHKNGLKKVPISFINITPNGDCITLHSHTYTLSHTLSICLFVVTFPILIWSTFWNVDTDTFSQWILSVFIAIWWTVGVPLSLILLAALFFTVCLSPSPLFAVFVFFVLLFHSVFFDLLC